MKITIAIWLLLYAAIAGAHPATGEKDSLQRKSGQGSTMLAMDYEKLVSRADLVYNEPVSRPEEGMPVGNGRMGSLVWTIPSSLKFQVNRVDIFGNSSASNNFYERNTDYCGGAGYVDVDFGEPVFTGPAFRQRLACYDGISEVQGKDVSVNVLAWNREDVMALQVNDRRKGAAPVMTSLRMLRLPVTKRGNHQALSRVRQVGDYIVLTQEFREDDYYCASAVVAGVAGRKATAEQTSESAIRLAAQPGDASFSIYIASAASFDPAEDVVQAALKKLEAAKQAGFNSLLEGNREWWHRYWQRAFVHLSSPDQEADFIEKHYTWYLYVMASSSQGAYPTKFNGMLWTTGGDDRKWGALYWGANQSCLYNALFQTNRLELLDPMFNMYSRAYGSYETAARQQWGSKGVYIPETTGFDDTPPLPDSIAAEMRDLYLLRKPWQQRSAAFMNYAYTKLPFMSRWNWKKDEGWKDGRWQIGSKGNSTFGHVSHIFSRGAKIAYQYWLRYEYTQDMDWLRNRAYPMLKGVAEFYRNFPNLKKEKDGKYHIYNINDNESIWGGHNTVEEISSMMGILPVAIRASQLLNVDAGMRAAWQELLEHLSPLPLSSDYAGNSGKVTWVRSLPPVVQGNGNWRPDQNTMPVWFFDLCTLESDPATLKIANNTYDSYFNKGIDSTASIYVLSKLPSAGAILGRTDATRYLILKQLRRRAGEEVLRNRMDLSEGFQTTNIQRLGRAAEALQYALCQGVPPGPGKDPVIHVFSAWPKEWDAQYTLLCRGGFLVTSSIRKGEIGFVELESQQGATCRIRNPWPGQALTLYRNGRKAAELKGSLLSFATAQNERLVLVPRGRPLNAYKPL